MMFEFITYAFLLSFFVAVFEIIVEKDKGWGTAFRKNKWYAKKFFIPIHKIIGTYPLLNYHFVMFFIIFPLFLWGLASYFEIALLYTLAIYPLALIVEDFLWFVLNPYFPSLRNFFRGPKGNIWWHRKWKKIGHVYIPTSYIVSIVLSALILLYIYVVS